MGLVESGFKSTDFVFPYPHSVGWESSRRTQGNSQTLCGATCRTLPSRKAYQAGFISSFSHHQPDVKVTNRDVQQPRTPQAPSISVWAGTSCIQTHIMGGVEQYGHAEHQGQIFTTYTFPSRFSEKFLTKALPNLCKNCTACTQSYKSTN